MEVREIQKNVHNIYLKGTKVQIALLSDIHWDNPKCDRKLLKRHLDYCKKESIPIVIVGDMFCLMQGRGDNRRNKSDILPEHNNSHYLDSVVETAVEWWAPYAHLITVIGYGNHETAIIKWQETDILKRFVKMMNLKHDANINVGGYGGWIVYTVDIRKSKDAKKPKTCIFKHKYFHGSGGGGIVTKGALNLTRALEMYEGMDIFSMGHIHENSSRNDVREILEFRTSSGYKLKHKQIHHCITGTYKEEYEDGSKGWHVERGAPPKPLGGRILELTLKEGGGQIQKKVDSKLFPI